MASLSTVTRDQVLATLRLFDELGADLFHATTGYRPAKVYTIRHNGRDYPSKAILGVAACLSPSDFFGGVAQAIPALQRLGFVILRAGRRVAEVGLELLARELELDGRRPYLPELPVDPAAVFASGSNRPGEVRGLAARGIDVGVAATELNEEALLALEELEGSDVQVFVDSGAFREVAVVDGRLEVVNPLTADDWRRVLDVYRRLAGVLGSQAWLIAPDRVGDQDATLARLAAHRDELLELRRLGARILVPLQRGRLELADFADQVDQVLGFADWLPAVPCKKAATSARELARFVARRRPRHVHLLGLGPRNRNLEAYLEPFAADLFGPSVSLDANWITANVGRQGRRPRLYTRARDLARSVLGQAATAARVAELALLAALAA